MAADETTNRMTLRLSNVDPVDPDNGTGAWLRYWVMIGTRTHGDVCIWTDGEGTSCGDDRSMWDGTLGLGEDVADDARRDAEGMAPEDYRRWLEGRATLSAEDGTDGWSVVDARGGRWWPSDHAASEIEASDDPGATALRIASEEPMRGEWRS